MRFLDLALAETYAMVPPANPFEALFLENLNTIQNIAGHVATRYRLSPQDREEFCSEVNLKLIGDDYKSLRQFEGRCQLESYLFMLINRTFWEWRNRLHGRWRPSTEAKRRGELAIKLEELTHRDGYRTREACQILESRYGLAETDCENLMQQLPRRNRREMISDSHLEVMPTQQPDPEESLLTREQRRLGERLEQSVNQVICALSPEDQLILKLNFRQGIKMVDIARSLGYTAKSIYKRVNRILANLNNELRRKGFAEENRNELLAAIRAVALQRGSQTDQETAKGAP